jgi:hypothetical protein
MVPGAAAAALLPELHAVVNRWLPAVLLLTAYASCCVPHAAEGGPSAHTRPSSCCAAAASGEEASPRCPGSGEAAQQKDKQAAQAMLLSREQLVDRTVHMLLWIQRLQHGCNVTSEYVLQLAGAGRQQPGARRRHPGGPGLTQQHKPDTSRTRRSSNADEQGAADGQDCAHADVDAALAAHCSLTCELFAASSFLRQLCHYY